MKVIKLLRGIGISSLLLSIPLLILLSNTQLNGEEREKENALYIYHSGESDKPVLPVVIAAKRPPDDRLKDIFGEDEWLEAIFYEVKIIDLENMISSLKFFFKEQKKDSTSIEYGTFKFTFIEKGKRDSRIFELEKFKEIINSFSKFISGQYVDLSNQFSSYRSRFNFK